MSAATATNGNELPLYVEYCTGCGFAKRFSELKAHMQKALPQVRVIGNRTPPRMKAFEVQLEDGTLLHSKIASGRFPDDDALVERLRPLLPRAPHSAGAEHSPTSPLLTVTSVVLPRAPSSSPPPPLIAAAASTSEAVASAVLAGDGKAAAAEVKDFAHTLRAAPAAQKKRWMAIAAGAAAATIITALLAAGLYRWRGQTQTSGARVPVAAAGARR